MVVALSVKIHQDGSKISKGENGRTPTMALEAGIIVIPSSRAVVVTEKVRNVI